MSERNRGVSVYPVTDKRVTGPYGDRYAIFENRAGELRVIHSEGVQYNVSDSNPWVWSDYDSTAEKFTPAQLKELAGEPVDLADWIRKFGSRLESNFYLAYSWATN